MKNEQSLNEALIKTDVMQSVLKASDLRVGNYVYFNKNHNELGEITEIKKGLVIGFDTVRIGYWQDKKHRISNLKAVPLKEEMLIKLGFKWSIAHQGFFKKDFYYVIDFYENYPKVEGSIAFLNKNHRNGEKLSSVRYVHELQNLYFALTGSELTVA